MPFIQWCTSGDPLHFIAHNGLILVFMAVGALPLVPALRAYAKEKLNELKRHDHTEDASAHQQHGHDEDHETLVE